MLVMCLDTFHLFRWQILFFFFVITIEKHLQFIPFFLFLKCYFASVPVKNLSVVLEVAVSIILSVFNRPVLQQ